MSDIDDLPYEEEDKFPLGFRKAARFMRAIAGDHGGGVHAVSDAIARSDQRRNPPITLPKLKFVTDPS